jgi:Mg2+ and Co2+ transporter CorA
VSIQALHSRADGRDELVDLAAWEPHDIPRDELLWVDLVDPTEEELQVAARALRMDQHTCDVMREEPGRPDAHVLAEAVQVVVLTPGPKPEDEPVPLAVLMGDEWVVTCHPVPIGYLDEHRERVQDEREVGLLTPVQFLASVLDWHIDAFFRVAETLEAEVDRLDDAALRTDRDLLQRLVGMRRRIARTRRLLVAHRELFAEIRRPDFFPGIEPAEADTLRAVAQRLDVATEAVANVREMLIGTFDVHMTRTAQRTNDIMKVLTWVSVILLPAGVLAGVMGMNFKLGFFDDPSMFWVVLVVMLLIAGVTLSLGRWRRWL